jgi:YVTN family beta-propeller protein
MNKLSFSLFLVILIFTEITSFAQSEYKMTRKIHVEGDGFWDYISIDEVRQHLFVSHGTVTQIIDIKTGQVIATIPDTKGVHGVALAPSLNKGFTSNGRDSSVTVFDLKTFKILTRILVTGANPDCILFDAFSQKVFTFNGRSSNATVIDAKENKVLATIPLDGKPEFSVSDGKGKIFVNIEDKSMINVIDANSNQVIKRWSIAPGEEPSGLALDNETHRLFSVCENKLMVISDAETGKIVTTQPIGAGCDGAAFDPILKRAYSSNGEGTVTVVQEESANSFKVLETIPTQAGARTMTVDKTNHHLYLPTAEFGEQAEGQRRPPVKPNTFVILDVEPAK